MSRMLICALIVVASAASAALGQADYIAKEALYSAGLAKFWQFQLPLDDEQRIADVYLVDDQLYCATDDGYVLAVHAHTGALRSIKKITDASHRIQRPAHSGGRTIYLSDIVLTQVNRLTGEGIMRRELGITHVEPAQPGQSPNPTNQALKVIS